MSKKEVDLHGKMSHFAAVAPSDNLEDVFICLSICLLLFLSLGQR